MEVVRHFRDMPQLAEAVATVGNFDGVHLGHRHVLARVVERARTRSLAAVAVTFIPHPVRVLSPGREPARLTPLDRKLELLAECGLDYVLVQPFDRRVAAMTPRQFAEEVLSRGVRARVIIVGDDFRFGEGRQGDIGLLRTIGPELGLEVEAAAPLRIDGEAVSSSRVRALLVDGQVEQAARLLGRAHDAAGVVVAGDGRGRQIGFPTANLGGLRSLLPGEGVYACWAHVAGAVQRAAVHVGARPTFGLGRSVEAHLLDFEGDLYGREMRLAFVARLRGHMRFDSVDALVAQIRADVERARGMLSDHGA